MRLPSSPLAVFATLCALILPTGAGLTAPIWLMVMGVRLDKAAAIGGEIIGVTVLAAAILFAAYWFLLRPRIEPVRPTVSRDGLPSENTERRDRMVHAVVWALFVLPFMLVVISFIYGQLEKLGLD